MTLGLFVSMTNYQKIRAFTNLRLTLLISNLKENTLNKVLLMIPR